jgi:peptide-N4-(N-acetyl-beta-glucosaminyl)asparagine amidase
MYNLVLTYIPDSLGYSGIKRSIAVEFDTYEGRDSCADPSSNHISIHTRGELGNSSHHRHSLGCTSNIPSLGGEGVIYARIVYRPSRQIEVFLCVAGEGASACRDEDFISVLDVRDVDVNFTEGYVGFTAATGGLHQEHRILDFRLYSL